jgi:hypothetical protein
MQYIILILIKPYVQFDITNLVNAGRTKVVFSLVVLMFTVDYFCSNPSSCIDYNSCGAAIFISLASRSFFIKATNFQ